MNTAAPSEPDFAQTKNCFGFTVRSLNRRISQRYDSVLRPFGLTIGQLNVLHVIKLFQPLAQSVISRKLSMEKSTLSREVEKLRQRGLVEWVESPDQRQKLTQLLPAGEQLLAQIFPVWEQAQQELAELLSSAALPELQRILQQLKQT